MGADCLYKAGRKGTRACRGPLVLRTWLSSSRQQGAGEQVEAGNAHGHMGILEKIL